LGILDFGFWDKFWILHKKKKTVHADPGRRIYKAKHVKEIEWVSFADESQNEWPLFLGNSLSCSTCGELGDGLTG